MHLRSPIIFVLSIFLATTVADGVASAQEFPLLSVFRTINDWLNGRQRGPDRLGFSVTENRAGTPLSPKKYYLVDMKCRARMTAADQISDALLITKSSFVSHSVWFSPNGNDVSVPQNPTKLVNLLQFDKDQSNQIVNFANGDCSERFIIKGSTANISVSFLIKDQRSLSPFGTATTQAAKALIGLVPVFLSGPLAATVIAGATGVAGAADPLKTTIDAYNETPTKNVKPYALRAGGTPMIIRTKFSELTLTISPITDISAQIVKEDALLESFYDVLNAMAANQLVGISSNTLSDKCAAFVTILNNRYSFSRKDASFVIGYFAQAASPGNVDGMLSCIRQKQNAQDIVDNEFVYNTGPSVVSPIQQPDIDNHDWTVAGVKLNSKTAWPYMEGLVGRLGAFGQSADEATKTSSRSAVVDWLGSQPSQIDDPAQRVWSGSSPAQGILLFDALLSKKFVRYGCFWLRPAIGGDDYDAVFLALPLDPANAAASTAYRNEDLVAIRVKLKSEQTRRSKGVITAYSVTREALAIDEAASKNKGVCGPDLRRVQLLGGAP